MGRTSFARSSSPGRRFPFQLRLGLACGLMLLLGVALLAGAARASVVLALSLEDLTRKAELVVVGVATEQQARRHMDGKLIVTDVSVKVQDVLKGSAKPGQT